MNDIYDLIEREDDPSLLRNDTNTVSWLTTPQVSQSPVHCVVVTDTGSEGENNEIYDDVDLSSHHSNQSYNYIKRQESDKESKERENVQYISTQKPIKIGSIIGGVCVISILLILMAHIGVIEIIKTTPPHNDILKTENNVKFRLWEKHNLTSPTKDTDPGKTNMSISRDTGGINNNNSQSTGVSRVPPSRPPTTRRPPPPSKVEPTTSRPPTPSRPPPHNKVKITPKTHNRLLTPSVPQVQPVNTPIKETTTSRMKDTSVTEITSNRSTKRWIYWTIK